MAPPRMSDDGPAVGEFRVCGARDCAPSVALWVGRIDTAADLGRDGDWRVVHVQMMPETGARYGKVDHAPFTPDAVLACGALRDAAMRPDREGFERGHAAWLDAHRAGRAGWFDLPPGEALVRIHEAIRTPRRPA